MDRILFRTLCRYIHLAFYGIRQRSKRAIQDTIPKPRKPKLRGGSAGVFRHTSYSAGTKANGGLRGGATRGRR